MELHCITKIFIWKQPYTYPGKINVFYSDFSGHVRTGSTGTARGFGENDHRHQLLFVPVPLGEGNALGLQGPLTERHLGTLSRCKATRKHAKTTQDSKKVGAICEM